LKTVIVSIAIAASMTLITGCGSVGFNRSFSSATPHYDSRFGESVRQSREQQVLNPSAGQHGDPVLGTDAQFGIATIERLREGFRKPMQGFDVGVGSGGTPR
jgi:hypothetical protein